MTKNSNPWGGGGVPALNDSEYWSWSSHKKPSNVVDFLKRAPASDRLNLNAIPIGRCSLLWRRPTVKNVETALRTVRCWWSHMNQHAYRVGSANFLRRKIGHAHDNSADSENVAGAREPSVHAHFIFRFENGQGNQSFFLSMTNIQLKRVNRKLSRRTVDAPSTGRFREASSGPEKSLVPHGLVEKKANFVDSRKLLFRRYTFKDTKHDRFGKRSVATEAEEIDDRTAEADVNALRRSMELFFLSFIYLRRLTTLDLRFLLWK